MRLNSNSTIREILTSSALTAVLDGALVGLYLILLLKVMGAEQRGVPPTRALAVVPGSPVRIEVEGLDRPLRGIVEQLAPEIDAASQMLFAEARLSAPEVSGAAIASGAVARVSLAAQVSSCSM